MRNSNLRPFNGLVRDVIQRKRRMTFRRSDLSARASKVAKEAKEAEETEEARGEIIMGTLP